MKSKCQECKFWEYNKERGEDDGICRRHSPTIMLSSISTKGTENWSWPETHFGCWPVTYRDDWCGEFKSKDAENTIKAMKRIDETKIDDDSIENLQLSARSKRVLRAMEIKTIGEIRQIDDISFMQFKNIGKTTVNDIRNAVMDYMMKHFRLSKNGRMK